MSMNLILKRVSAADIGRLMTAPEGIDSFLAAGRVEPDRGPEYAAARAEMIRQLEAEGLPISAPPAPPEAFGFDAYAFNGEFDAQKLWHALHFLLTGQADSGELPAGTLLMAGEPVPGDVGYGPAMAISPEDTRAFNDHLAALSRDAFLERLDPGQMSELQIYPDIWDEDRAELQSGIGAYFDELRSYCRKCVDHGLGMIRVIS